jgi:hypothetical protein
MEHIKNGKWAEHQLKTEHGFWSTHACGVEIWPHYEYIWYIHFHESTVADIIAKWRFCTAVMNPINLIWRYKKLTWLFPQKIAWIKTKSKWSLLKFSRLNSWWNCLINNICGVIINLHFKCGEISNAQMFGAHVQRLIKSARLKSWVGFFH